MGDVWRADLLGDPAIVLKRLKRHVMDKVADEAMHTYTLMNTAIGYGVRRRDRALSPGTLDVRLLGTLQPASSTGVGGKPNVRFSARAQCRLATQAV